MSNPDHMPGDVVDLVNDLMRRLTHNEREHCSPVVTNWNRSKERAVLRAAIKQPEGA